jgi:tRNA pseudouridine38-40 synthase
MVRNMVGTLVEIGRGERPVDDVPRILAARRRSACGRMAPPQGLFLEEVIYPGEDASAPDPTHPEGGTP